jgi:hypothetical protein
MYRDLIVVAMTTTMVGIKARGMQGNSEDPLQVLPLYHPSGLGHVSVSCVFIPKAGASQNPSFDVLQLVIALPLLPISACGSLAGHRSPAGARRGRG